GSKPAAHEGPRRPPRRPTPGVISDGMRRKSMIKIEMLNERLLRAARRSRLGRKRRCPREVQCERSRLLATFFPFPVIAFSIEYQYLFRMFRPCIDLHDGQVKQIVGGTLSGDPALLQTNFVAERPASWFAELYRRDQLRGGHVIMLGPGNEPAAR